MTGRERVAMAMNLKTGDRVPFFCQLSLGHYMLNTDFEPYKVWHSPEIFTDALHLIATKYGADGVLVNLPGRPRDWESRIKSIEKSKNETRINWINGYTVCPNNDNAHYFSENTVPTIDEIEPDTLYYIEPHDISGIKYPFYYGFEKKESEPARPKKSPKPAQTPESFFPDYILDNLRLAIKKCHPMLHVSSEVFSPFSQLMELLNYENGLLALMDEPKKCERILEQLSLGASHLAVLQAVAGADAVLVSSAFAGGGFISREMYTRFVLPYEKQICRKVHESSNARIYVHTCGSIGDRIDLMLEAGYDGVDTMDPPPLGNTDIFEVKKKYGEKIFLKGNIDPVNIIRYGKPEQVYAQASKLIEGVGKGGGYILSSACSIAPEAPPENIKALHQAAIDYPH